MFAEFPKLLRRGLEILIVNDAVQQAAAELLGWVKRPKAQHLAELEASSPEPLLALAESEPAVAAGEIVEAAEMVLEVESVQPDGSIVAAEVAPAKRRRKPKAKPVAE